MSYDGGKGGPGVYQWIINQIPPHTTFISCFLGHCAVMRYIRPAEVRIGIEVDPAVVADYWHDADGVTIVVDDAVTALERLRRDKVIDHDTFVYADPPYVQSTRSGQAPIYRHEYGTIEDHRALLKCLRRLPCMVAVSGYWSPLYELELPGWRSSTFHTVNRAGDRTEEWIWMNYGEPMALHDYRYLGRDFRERERIKRKTQRWVDRLRGMPTLERLAIMHAVDHVRACTVDDGEAAADAPEPIVTNDDGRANRRRRRGAPATTAETDDPGHQLTFGSEE